MFCGRLGIDISSTISNTILYTKTSDQTLKKVCRTYIIFFSHLQFTLVDQTLLTRIMIILVQTTNLQTPSVYRNLFD